LTRRSFLSRLAIGAAAILATPRRAAALMDTTKMQAVASAITNAGFSADIRKQDDGSWKVRARSSQMDIPVASAHNLATVQGVNGNLSEIEYS
jgi:formyltetrahydrofolate synthetase